MNSAIKKNDFGRMCRIRCQNLKFKTGKIVTFSILTAIFLLFEWLSMYYSINYSVDYDSSNGNTFTPDVASMSDLMPFIFSLLACITLIALTVFIVAAIFASDKSTNQMSLELRSGYSRKDIYSTKIIETLVIVMIPFVIALLSNGITYGVWKNSAQFTYVVYEYGGETLSSTINNIKNWGVQQNCVPWFNGNPGAELIMNALWWYLVAILSSGLITFGLSFTSNTGGAAAGGAILGIVITIVVLIASVGLFSYISAIENSKQNVFKWPWWSPFFTPGSASY